jgi:hypothetical protein
MTPRHHSHSSASRTLTQYLCPHLDEQLSRDLEVYRIDYEAEHGRTDIAKQYTTQLPPKDQTWLMDNHIDHFMDGLPPYVRDFQLRIAEQAMQEGRLDNKPAVFIDYFLRNRLRGNDGHSR